jgi:hypothetical protein
MIRQTHTYATMEVPPELYYLVRKKLTDAGYSHAINDKDCELYMQGIALVPTLEVDRSWRGEMPPEVVAAQAKLNDVTRRFESQFKVYPVVGNTMHAATGEEYVEVTAGGIAGPDRSDTATWCSYFATADEAITGWEDVVDRYAKNVVQSIVRQFDPLVLYWRMLPEIGIPDPADAGKWKIYSRFLISGKPAKYPARLSVQEQSYRFPVVTVSEESRDGASVSRAPPAQG